VWSQFDRTLNVIPLGGPELEAVEGDDDKQVRRIELPADPKRQLSVAQALGRSLFHATGDTRIARDGRACASCHPDGRDDGLVWATPNGARRTKMLAGMLAHTAPYAWDGDAEQLRDHVTETFKRLNGVGGLRSVELRALMAYVQSLAPPVVPHMDVDDAQVRRGADVFASHKAGCTSCHAGEHYTDNKSHDVQSKSPSDRAAKFNTPSLRFLSARAPYYHDGRYATLRELLDGTDGSMGHTKHLSSKDLDALEAFLKTL
jgi:cytochrome c peroxidase